MFTPTKEELEEIGFEKSGYTDAMIYVKGNKKIFVFDGTLHILHLDIYPQSIEDIKTLIRLFTKS